jgi:uncharacterized phage protein (TIGR02218 family)
MRKIEDGLAAILKTRQYVRCNLFTLTLANGVSYYFNDAGVDITVNNQTYPHAGPQFTGAKYELVRGMQVSTLDLNVMMQPTDLIGGVTWAVAARSGLLRNADLLIQRAYAQDWGQPFYALSIFEGYIDESSNIEGGLTLSVVSNAQLLNTSIPRYVFQPGCMRVLYDAGCGVDRAAFSVNGNVQGDFNRVTFGTNLTQADGWFAQGDITFQTGNNAGVRRAVKVYASGAVTLSYPLNFDLADGDAFVIAAGCDHTLGTNGCAKFANQSNFKATPYVPPPESAV